jgi:hypothetical protein
MTITTEALKDTTSLRRHWLVFATRNPQTTNTENAIRVQRALERLSFRILLLSLL